MIDNKLFESLPKEQATGIEIYRHGKVEMAINKTAAEQMIVQLGGNEVVLIFCEDPEERQKVWQLALKDFGDNTNTESDPFGGLKGVKEGLPTAAPEHRTTVLRIRNDGLWEKIDWNAGALDNTVRFVDPVKDSDNGLKISRTAGSLIPADQPSVVEEQATAGGTTATGLTMFMGGGEVAMAYFKHNGFGNNVATSRVPETTPNEIAKAVNQKMEHEKWEDKTPIIVMKGLM